MRLNNQTELVKTIFRTLEIPPGTPFRCKGVEDTWYKLTKDCIPLWDAGTDQKEWFDDWVVLNHLLEGKLEPDLSSLKREYLETALEFVKVARELDYQPSYKTEYSKLHDVVEGLQREIELLKF